MITSDNKIKCFNCHMDLDLAPGAKIMRSEECPSCYANIHSCKMCQFYDQTAYNECRETSADRIVEKEMANFCDYYILKGSGGSNNQDDAAAAANALFKN